MTDTRRETEFDGLDLAEALQAASAAWRTPPERLVYEIVEEGRRGVLGLGARRVRIRIVEADAAPMRARPLGDERTSGDAAEAAPPGLVDTLARMIDLMGLDAAVTATRHPGGWTLRVEGPARQALTKRDGELLHAVEFLLNRMARRAWPDAGSIHLAVEGFRDRRDEDIVELAREVAAMVARSGRAEVLHEMNPYERRLVHLTAREYPDLRTVSEGDGFLKRIRIEKDRG